MDRLLCTPFPYEDESIGGYLLRLSHENHYENIKWLYDLLDFSAYHNKNIAYLSINNTSMTNILQYTGITVEKFDCMSFHTDLELIKSTIKPSQNIKLQRHGVNSKYSKICPMCFNEHSYHKRIWEIPINNTCPKHNCFLIARCPKCRKYISTYRNKLLHCDCGFPFNSLPIRIATKKQTFLSKILDTKVNNSCYFENDRELLSSPLFYFKNVMHIILLLINIVQKVYYEKYGESINVREPSNHSKFIRVLGYVQNIFINWPLNFITFLKEFNHLEMYYTPLDIGNSYVYRNYICDINLGSIDQWSIEGLFWKGFLIRELDVSQNFLEALIY